MVELLECPKCDSLDIWKWGIYMTIKGKKQRYNCKNCGHVWGKKIEC